MHSVSQLTKKKTGCGDENITTHPRNHAFPDKILAVPINGTGTGTWGRGRWDACTGTWDSGARDKGFRDVKLLGCGYAKYGKWESHVKYRKRLQAKYRTWGRNCKILLWLEPAFNVHRVNSFCYMKTFMSPLYMVFTKPISSFIHTCLNRLSLKPNTAAVRLAGHIQS